MLVITLACTIPGPALAIRGIPNSATFGYGARLDMWGDDIYTAVELASGMNLDWLAIDVDWARLWPTLDQQADFSPLDRVLQAARQKGISVLLSLNHAPDWAITPNGPEPNFTNALLQSILNVYSDVIQAVELFPGVNSYTRWGATPNPDAYLTMLHTVQQGCNASGRTIYLVTTLEPLPLVPGAADGSLDAPAYLERLYNLGGSVDMPIVGIRYPFVTGAPMTESSDLYPIVLRHYENIRAVMLKFQHTRGMIWITGFSWPVSGTHNPADPLALPATPAHQAQWVHQAIQLLRAQLFIGTAFFDAINRENTAQSLPILSQPGGSIHPASVTISKYAGGNVSSTAWTAPQMPMELKTATSTPATASVNFNHSATKPQK